MNDGEALTSVDWEPRTTAVAAYFNFPKTVGDNEFT
jgi:hypothetical protein